MKYKITSIVILSTLIGVLLLVGVEYPTNQENKPMIAGVTTNIDSENIEQTTTTTDSSTTDNHNINETIVVSESITFDDDANKEGNRDSEITKEVHAKIEYAGSSSEQKKLFDVIAIIDGDTIKISELGTLRLIGMDTPETKDPRLGYVECFGQEATKKATEILAGKKVYLEFDPLNRIDRYGRTLAYLYRDDGYFFNKQMIQEGYAHSYTKYLHPRMEEFNSAQKQAQTSQIGLWSSSTCDGDTKRPNHPVPKPQNPHTSPSPLPTPQIQHQNPVEYTPPQQSPPTTSTPIAQQPSPCHPSYPTICLAPTPDLDCKDIPHKRFVVLHPDIHRLDRDNNGIGCET